MKHLRFAVWVGNISWRQTRLRKLCAECEQPMRLVSKPGASIAVDTNPPQHWHIWTCDKGHAEDAGNLDDESAAELRAIFESE